MTAICTLPEALDHAVSQWGDDIFIEDGDILLSYRECAQQVDHMAKHFIALGVTANDCVALWMP
ncbi:MAG TPA: AMP-binding protein, partial [Pseudomonadales bacterium]|nr:AMP-binding protein [Pseudomonadales bacterium]